MSVNLTLYYLVTTLVLVISIFIVLTILISLFRCLFSSSCASALSKRRIKIVFFIEYDILIVFIDCGIFLIRLISVFNFSIRSVFGILFDFFCFMNINLFTISAFFVFILSILFFFWTVFYWFWFYSRFYIAVIFT